MRNGIFDEPHEGKTIAYSAGWIKDRHVFAATGVWFNQTRRAQRIEEVEMSFTFIGEPSASLARGRPAWGGGRGGRQHKESSTWKRSRSDWHLQLDKLRPRRSGSARSIITITSVKVQISASILMQPSLRKKRLRGRTDVCSSRFSFLPCFSQIAEKFTLSSKFTPVQRFLPQYE